MLMLFHLATLAGNPTQKRPESATAHTGERCSQFSKKMTRLIITIIISLTFKFALLANNTITANLCEILGMLSEYNSRFDYPNGEPHDSLIESFYPGEEKLALYFKDLIKEYEKETSNSFPLYEIVGNQGHIYLYSKSLSLLINSFNVLDTNELASLNRDLIISKSDDLKYAYLKGAYLRFGKGNEISIANGIFKLRTIALVMKSLDIHNLKLYKTREDYTPTNYILTFERNDFLEKKINLQKSRSQLDLAIYKQIDIY